MAQSTGPVLAASGIVIFNAIVVQRMGPRSQLRVAVGGLITAAALSLVEQAAPRVAIAGAWLVLVGTLLVRVNPSVPSPIESIEQFINGS